LSHKADPNSFYEAISGNERENWVNAIQEELAELIDRGTFSLLEHHPSMHIITSKWVFKKKLDANGEVERYKAQLCARGFTQRYLVDYFETTSPVAAHTTTRLFLFTAVQEGLHLIKYDVKNAYLNSSVDEDIYMHIPQDLKVN